MGKAIPTRHPAVVLRSQYRQLRTLLAVAMVAVVGLTIAVVILAGEGGQSAATSSVQPPAAVPLTSPPTSTRYDGGPEEGTRGAIGPSSVRYDGGPEEGTRGVR
jgi:hypothetical protein